MPQLQQRSRTSELLLESTVHSHCCYLSILMLLKRTIDWYQTGDTRILARGIRTVRRRGFALSAVYRFVLKARQSCTVYLIKDLCVWVGNNQVLRQGMCFDVGRWWRLRSSLTWKTCAIRRAVHKNPSVIMLAINFWTQVGLLSCGKSCPCFLAFFAHACATKWHTCMRVRWGDMLCEVPECRPGLGVFAIP